MGESIAERLQTIGENLKSETNAVERGVFAQGLAHSSTSLSYPTLKQGLGHPLYRRSINSCAQSFRQPAQIHSLFNFLANSPTVNSPTLQLPLTNANSQRQLTHSSTFPSYAGANKRATGKRQESPSPVCTIVSQVNTCILNQGCNRAMFRVPCPENCRFSFFGFGFFLGTIFDIYYAN